MREQFDSETLSSLIGDIYACSIDRSRWIPTLERLAGAFAACNGTILSHDARTVSFDYQWGTPPEWIQAYAENFAAINPLSNIGWHAEVDEPITALRFMTADELRRTRFHREFLAPLNWFDFIAVILEKSAARFSLMSFTRHVDQEPPGEREFALIRLIVPHVRRAVIFHGIVEREAARAADFATVFDRLETPILLFDAAGSCIETNAAARAFLSTTDALWLDGGGVKVRAGDLRAPVDGSHGDAPMSFAFDQADGRHRVAHVLPLTDGFRDRMGRQRRAVSAMFIQAVGALQPLPGEVLVRLYGLTPAETRLIVLLARDHSLGEAAATLGIARTTARTHLQRIFEKTGTRRQSQLMKLVLSTPPPA